jgi:Gram-negative bacterial TonB protein C-terminal
MKQPPLRRRARLLSTQILFVVIFWSMFGHPGYSQALPPGSPEYDTMNEIARLRGKILKNKALEAYKQAIQARPNFAGVIYETARTHLEMNDPEAARAQHATLTKIDALLADFLRGEIKRAEKRDSATVAATSPNIAPQQVTPDDALGRKPYLMVYEKTKLPTSIKNFEMNGEVKLNVLINSDGSASDIKPVAELSFGLTEIAIEAIEKFQFQPAIKLGKPVPTRIIFTYTFWLD